MPIDKKEVRAKAVETAGKVIGDYFKNFDKTQTEPPVDLQTYVRWTTDVAKDLENYIETGERA